MKLAALLALALTLSACIWGRSDIVAPSDDEWPPIAADADADAEVE